MQCNAQDLTVIQPVLQHSILLPRPLTVRPSAAEVKEPSRRLSLALSLSTPLASPGSGGRWEHAMRRSDSTT